MIKITKIQIRDLNGTLLLTVTAKTKRGLNANQRKLVKGVRKMCADQVAPAVIMEWVRNQRMIQEHDGVVIAPDMRRV